MFRIFRRRSNIFALDEITKPISSRLGSSTKLRGVIFVLLTVEIDDLNYSYSRLDAASQKHKARFINVIGRLLQFVIEGDTIHQIEQNTQSFVDDASSATEGNVIMVWTVQQCSVGLWGNDNFVHFAAIVPNFQNILLTLGSLQPGSKKRL